MYGESIFIESICDIGDFVEAAEVECDGTAGGKSKRAVADTGKIFCEGDIANVMVTVFDAPMTADGMGVGLRWQLGGRDVKGFFGMIFQGFFVGSAALGVAFDDDEIGQKVVPFSIQSDKIVPYRNGALFGSTVRGDGWFFIHLIGSPFLGGGIRIVQ